MSEFCGDECKQTGPVCDFCSHYSFNPDDQGRYTGNGFCNLHQKASEPSDGCNDFVCYWVNPQKQADS